MRPRRGAAERGAAPAAPPPPMGPLLPRVNERVAAFRTYLARAGLKGTRQRDAIVRAFLGGGGHLTVWQLHQQVMQDDPRINVATVFRTLKLLCRAGVAVERHFAHSLTRYEAARPPHHHLVCTQCGHIEEFEHDGLERIQTDVARRAAFALAEGRVELYGLCRDCRRDKSGARQRRLPARRAGHRRKPRARPPR